MEGIFMQRSAFPPLVSIKNGLRPVDAIGGNLLKLHHKGSKAVDIREVNRVQAMSGREGKNDRQGGKMVVGKSNGRINDVIRVREGKLLVREFGAIIEGSSKSGDWKVRT